MQQIMYRGQKAILITTDDIMQMDTPRLRKEIIDKIRVLKEEGALWLFVVTSLPIIALPKKLRDMMGCISEKGCYVAQL